MERTLQHILLFSCLAILSCSQSHKEDLVRRLPLGVGTAHTDEIATSVVSELVGHEIQMVRSRAPTILPGVPGRVCVTPDLSIRDLIYIALSVNSAGIASPIQVDWDGQEGAFTRDDGDTVFVFAEWLEGVHSVHWGGDRVEVIRPPAMKYRQCRVHRIFGGAEAPKSSSILVCSGSVFSSSFVFRVDEVTAPGDLLQVPVLAGRIGIGLFSSKRGLSVNTIEVEGELQVEVMPLLDDR